MVTPRIYWPAEASTTIRRRRFRTRSGVTILELLVVMGIVGILLGFLLPAAQSAREAARNLQCKNNLHQMGLALHSYHNVHGTLPLGWRLDDNRETAFGWAAAILPALDEYNLWNGIDYNAHLDAATNAAATRVTPSVFLCPSDFSTPLFELYEEHGVVTTAATPLSLLIKLPAANYDGVFGTSDPDEVPGDSGEGVFIEDKSIRFAELFRGLTQTLLVGERTARKLPSTWLGIVMNGEDAPGRIVGNVWLGPNRRDSDECEFDSRHPGHTNFLWADGHVHSISDSVDTAMYRQLSTRQ